MKKLIIISLLCLYTCITYPSRHKVIKKLRNAAANGTLASTENREILKKIDHDALRAQIKETLRFMTDPSNENDVAGAFRKKINRGVTKIGLASFFGFGTCFFAFKSIPYCLQLEDEQARVSGLFWSTIGGLSSFGAACFFGTKGIKNIWNNSSQHVIKKRLKKHRKT